MANRKREPGARRWRKKAGGAATVGWCSSPLSVLRAGDVFERSVVWCWILHGNYSSSLLFDTVPLTDR